jgi:PTH2 family peptidyl-tRNA hydrolase
MDIKQVIVIRRDLKMRRGKEITQGAHASMAFMIESNGNFDQIISNWLLSGQTKITLQIQSEEELVSLHELAKMKGLRSHLITDAGRTEFDGIPTKTCLAIGPNKSEKIDKLTGNLKLY